MPRTGPRWCFPMKRSETLTAPIACGTSGRICDVRACRSNIWY
ncbi:TPA: hypothetical protein N0F65_003338 [Lagenidium giganteum]|uniref:Uncharacterized protein n=1 Tax=Lagenidium giganteum TaxID=4803 RepID=A0AAV2Z9V5_9STRA|nr:TPA: hypothetical protein N0F65_003338 [Lagenidium giganteum]